MKHGNIWLAIVTPTLAGYVLDAFPGELERYHKQLGSSIVGEFPTAAEARAAVRKKLYPEAKQ